MAHSGRVTGILPTPDGLHWLTAGTDNRLRLWDTQHNYHLLVNYPLTFNSSMKVSAVMQLATDQPVSSGRSELTLGFEHGSLDAQGGLSKV